MEKDRLARKKDKYKVRSQQFDLVIVVDRLLTGFDAPCLFTVFAEKTIEDYGITEKEYEDYYGHYLNVMEELREDKDDTGNDENELPVNMDYEPQAYGKVKIDYDYIMNLIQDIVSSPSEETEEEFQQKMDEIRGYISDFSESNEKLGGMLLQILEGIEKDRESYRNKSISMSIFRKSNPYFRNALGGKKRLCIRARW